VLASIVIRGRSTCEFCLFAEEIGGGDIDHRGLHGDGRAGARTETSTRAGRELQKLSPRCLPCWLAGSEQAESISPAAASQSPRRAQNLAGTHAAYVTIFLRSHLYLRHVPFVFTPCCIISEKGESLKQTPQEHNSALCIALKKYSDSQS
jgi:hypothetical protein